MTSSPIRWSRAILPGLSAASIKTPEMQAAQTSGLRRLIGRFPMLVRIARRIGHRYFARTLGRYPRPLGDEIGAVAAVLHGSQWNMTGGHAHERLEADFATYVDVPHAVAVNTGGVALQ